MEKEKNLPLLPLTLTCAGKGARERGSRKRGKEERRESPPPPPYAHTHAYTVEQGEEKGDVMQEKVVRERGSLSIFCFLLSLFLFLIFLYFIYLCIYVFIYKIISQSF